MSNEKILKAIMEIKDNLIYSYDQLRLSEKVRYDSEFTKSFLKVKDSIKRLDDISKEYIDSMPNCFEIVVLKNTVVENEEEVEIKTNITGYHFEDEDVEFVFDGCIPSEGYIGLSCTKQKWGIEIKAKNNVPRKVMDEYETRGYHFCDPTTSKYFEPGVYMFTEGTVIGIGIIHQKSKQRVMDLPQN